MKETMNKDGAIRNPITTDQAGKSLSSSAAPSKMPACLSKERFHNENAIAGQWEITSLGTKLGLKVRLMYVDQIGTVSMPMGDGKEKGIEAAKSSQSKYWAMAGQENGREKNAKHAHDRFMSNE